MKKLAVPVLLGLLFIFTGCPKRDEIPFLRIYRDYVVYNVNSLWIYRDSADHAKKDTVKLLSSNIFDETMCSGGVCNPTQNITSDFISSVDSIYTVTGNAQHASLFGSEDTAAPFYLKSSIYYYFKHPFSGKNVNNSQFISGPDTMTINNVHYKDVVEFHNEFANRTVFWSKHVGIIKSIFHRRVWELESFSVKQ